ncbi:MAG: hypothetical protein ACKVOP_04540 [Sphingomonadaceae bacterium]
MKLIFVYNANAGLAAGIMDSVHKLVSPSTYACDLCAITYGLVRMDPKWKAWLNAQAFEAVFHHRPDFHAAYPALAALALPAILTNRAGTLEPVVTAPEFAGVTSVNELIALIEQRLDIKQPDGGEYGRAVGR